MLSLWCFVDINECTLGIDECDRTATCNDTIGSCNCECNVGFVRDGFNYSGKTHTLRVRLVYLCNDLI